MSDDTQKITSELVVAPDDLARQDTIVKTLMGEWIVRERYHHKQHFSRQTTLDIDEAAFVLRLGGRVIARHMVTEDETYLLLALPDSVAMVQWMRLPDLCRYSGAVAAASEAACRAFAAMVQALPSSEPQADDRVRVRFWTYGEHGPQSTERHLAAAGWEDIRQNYTGQTRTPLARVMKFRPPLDGGQLLLFHGAPGTGRPPPCWPSPGSGGSGPE